VEHVARQTSAATAAMRYRGLSAVFGWLAKPGGDDEPYIERNPVKGLEPPKFQEEPVPILSLEDAKRLVAACRGLEESIGKPPPPGSVPRHPRPSSDEPLRGGQ
jgi:integrase